MKKKIFIALTLLFLIFIFLISAKFYYLNKQINKQKEVSEILRETISPKTSLVTKTPTATPQVIIEIEDVGEIEEMLVGEIDLEELPDFDLSLDF